MIKFEEKVGYAERFIKFTVDVMIFAKTIRESDLFFLKDQLLRSTASIGANVTEAHGSNTAREFRRYLSIALASAKECKYWLLVLQTYRRKAYKNMNNTALESLLKEVTEFIKILSKSVSTIKKRHMSKNN